MIKLPEQPNLYVFNRFGMRMNNHDLPVYIFGSSSAGNSTYVKPLRIELDLGLPMSRFDAVDPDFFNHVDYVFLTHEHSDHFNPATVFALLHGYPQIKFILPIQMWNTITDDQFRGLTTTRRQAILSKYRDRFIIIKGGMKLTSRVLNSSMYFTPYSTIHGNIVNMAVDIKIPEANFHMLYSTDLQSTEGSKLLNITGLPHDITDPYDILMLEANYNGPRVRALIQKMGRYSRPEQNLRHLSEKQSIDYARRYTKSNGIYIPMHGSPEFGTYCQDPRNINQIKEGS